MRICVFCMEQEALSEIMGRSVQRLKKRRVMKASNERTLSFIIAESFEIAISCMVRRLLGPSSIDITIFCY